MKEKTLNVQMLGGFVVNYGRAQVVPVDARNSKMVQLLQYLLVNRNKMIRQTELIDVLLGDEECSNPTGTLKNIVYRLRKLLIAAGLPKDIIVYRKSAYGFCGSVSCEVDTEKFVRLTIDIQNMETAEEKRLALCLQAADIYKGEFLRKASAEPWVMTKSVYYQELYVNCIVEAYTIAQKNKDFDKILVSLSNAVSIYPYEEDLYLIYISCMYELGHVKEAIAKYEAVVGLLYDDLGIGPSARLKDLYQKITGGMQEVSNSVIDIRSKLSEQRIARGPYYTNVESFSSIFQFVVRHMERSGKSVFLMLCTITELDGSAPKIGSRMSKVASAFQEAVRLTCRRGDVYTRYSSSQFLLMLMELKQEDCNMIADRLRYCFYRMPKMSKVRLTCKCVSAADMDNILDGADLRNYPLDWRIDPKQAEIEEAERRELEKEQAWLDAADRYLK